MLDVNEVITALDRNIAVWGSQSEAVLNLARQKKKEPRTVVLALVQHEYAGVMDTIDPTKRTVHTVASVIASNLDLELGCRTVEK